MSYLVPHKEASSERWYLVPQTDRTAGANFPGHKSLSSIVDFASGRDNALHVRLRASWSSNFEQSRCNMAARVFEIAGRRAGRQAGGRLTGGREGRFRRDLKTLVETSRIPNNSQRRNAELRDLHKLCECI